MTFAEDVIKGEKAEREVQDLLGGKKIEGNFPYYDLLIEVKCDFQWQDTGNVAIEIGTKEKPAGLSITKSEYYIYKLDKLYYCKTEKIFRYLREYIQNNPRCVISCGDGNRARNVILPLKNFHFIFKELFK